MSDPALGLLMLTLIVVVIMMGFATAFTLMGLGIFFGFIAFYNPAETWWHNRVFDLMVQRTYGAMTNDVLISIPLFVLMGYVMERGALVDKMFYSIQLAFRRVPASLAVATLIVCTFWGIASGLVGAVVVLMGVIAFNPMLRAGYDVKLASGVITAGGTLGILIPPSVMIIVYAAVAGQSVVKLYAAAMFPGFFLSFLYLVYIVGWALINPKIAPKLPEEQTRVPVPAWVPKFQHAYTRNMLLALGQALLSPSRAGEIEIDGRPINYWMLVKNFVLALVPFLLIALTLWGIWWYVVIHQQAVTEAAAVPGVQQLGSPDLSAKGPATPAELGPGTEFYFWFWLCVADRQRALRGAEARDLVGDAARHPHRARAGGNPVRHHHRDRIRRRWGSRRVRAGISGANARLEAHQGGGVPHRQDDRDGVLVVRRLSAVLRGVRDPRRSGPAGKVGALAQHVAGPIHDSVAGDHFSARLAAGMDRDHHHFRADLSALAQAFQYRPGLVGDAGVREPAGGIFVAAGRDVGVLSEGRRAAARHPQPDFRRHDAVHAGRDPLHGDHVSLAGDDAVAARLPLWRVSITPAAAYLIPV
jgi:TRAP-type mannitol/chloroaromatic compound transport system permease large subunit